MSVAALARAVRDAVTGVPGVTRLTGGGPVEVAARFPGGRIAGLRLTGDVVEVRIAIDRLPVHPIADRAHDAAVAALRRAGDDRPVRVLVADIDTESLPEPKG